MPDDRAVSVCMIAFNHERYIAQALDSVLKQETSFPVDIVVGEDCSRDSTRRILLDYAERHPGRIRPLLADRNRGMMANFLSTLAACRGRYVAVCEADDYWLDSGKLQKQVDYLESHPECAVSFHNAYMEARQQVERAYHENEDLVMQACKKAEKRAHDTFDNTTSHSLKRRDEAISQATLAREEAIRQAEEAFKNATEAAEKAHDEAAARAVKERQEMLEKSWKERDEKMEQAWAIYSKMTKY